jgi:hypothetical protein
MSMQRSIQRTWTALVIASWFATCAVGTLGCARPRSSRLPVIATPTPILADAADAPGAPEKECGQVVADLRRYSQCELLDDNRKWQMARWLEYVEIDLALAKNPSLDDASKRQIAVACHKAALMMGSAADRCVREAAARGPEPRGP